jgi:predicted nucleotidyltransferase
MLEYTHETVHCLSRKSSCHSRCGGAPSRLQCACFGSVLRGDDQEGSDLDILIDPTPDTTMFDIGAIRHELFQLLGVHVDVLTPNALPDSFRAKVIAEARPV